MYVGNPSKKEVKAQVERLGMTHLRIAELLGVSRSAVDKWTGKTDAREIPPPCWTLLLLLADEHPTHKLLKRSRNLKRTAASKKIKRMRQR
jgi:DNA-binding transcriptional regulator YiaG